MMFSFLVGEWIFHGGRLGGIGSRRVESAAATAGGSGGAAGQQRGVMCSLVNVKEVTCQTSKPQGGFSYFALIFLVSDRTSYDVVVVVAAGHFLSMLM
ncbi:hypothetical protein RHMOL_Rhmol08G0139000 [Rhododendron molle]|uniref:Uncharacterized protein n=1 Tax=Rhododendron molle TaxID=49168 RepID=A0ACC0MPH2_RHOML|nr:hypothetical protein RHMOL_Rhmol08G0139000 [Rhododendron molle]